MRRSEAPFEHAHVVHYAASDGVVREVGEVGLEHHEPVPGPVGHYLRGQEARSGPVDGHEVFRRKWCGCVPPVHLRRCVVPEEHRGAAIRAQNHLRNQHF